MAHSPSSASPLKSQAIVSVRLSGYYSSIEAIFGARNQRLTIRHDAAEGHEPYIEGTLLAIRKVRDRVGLVRGLDRVMDL